MITSKFRQLPYGSVKPAGYLNTQLTLQKDNITSKMELYDDFSADSAWLGGNGERWERGPYYVRGLVGVAYLSGDAKLIEKAKKWIDFSVDTQKDNGDFGPCDDWWAKMPMLDAVRDYYEAELYRGFEDRRIIPFFKRYFDFQLKELSARPLKSSSYWAEMRGADNVEVVLWLVDRLRSSGEDAEKYEGLAEMLLEQTFDWCEKYRSNNLSEHVVNITQGMKYPYMRYRVTGDKESLNLRKGLEAYRKKHGRIDYLPNADESTRDNLPTHGTETCAVVEGINSLGIDGAVLGEGWVYDLAECYCYNSLPNCFTYDISGYCYFQLQNSVLCTHGSHGFVNDHGDSCAYGLSGFECCFSNMHMGYPKFIQNMWAECDGGVALTAYGTSRLETKSRGMSIVFDEVTHYPYADDVKLIYRGDSGCFRLLLRLPDWSKSNGVFVNGSEYEFDADGDFAVIDREFQAGDVISVRFESAIEVHDWHGNSFYVKKGAVLYCLPVKEHWQMIETNDFRELKYKPRALSNREIYPMSAWNYTFEPKEENMRFVKKVFEQEKMISPDSAPAGIDVTAYRAVNWHLKGNIADTVECAVVDKAAARRIRLVPYGFTRLKISVFPKTAEQLKAENDAVISEIKDALFGDCDKIKRFSISAQAAFGMVQVAFPFSGQNAVYGFLFTDGNGHERYFGNQKFNAYTFNESGESLITLDKLSFEADNNTSYRIVCASFEDGRITGVSDEITIGAAI